MIFNLPIMLSLPACKIVIGVSKLQVVMLRIFLLLPKHLHETAIQIKLSQNCKACVDSKLFNLERLLRIEITR